MEKFIYDVFASDKVHKLTGVCFHEDIYTYADNYAAMQDFHSLWQIYPIIGAYIVQHIIMNRGEENYPTVYERMKETLNAGQLNPDLRLKDVRIPTISYLFPFEMIPQGSNIILYGAGKAGQCYCEQIKKSGYCNVIGWVDRNYEEKGIQSPEIIENNHMFDYIVIVVVKEKDVRQIRISLLDKGVDESKIIWRNPEYVKTEYVL